MKTTGILTIILVLVLLSCNRNNSTKKTIIEQTENLQYIDTLKDKEEIQNRIRQTLNWAESQNSINFLPVLTDSTNSINIGFNLNQHKSNLDKLSATKFFTNGFIENYNQIILTLDKNLKNNEYGKWLVGDLPPFTFASDIDPWTLCQDVPYDKPNPFENIEVKITNINDNKAEGFWKWGKLEIYSDSSWEDFLYSFSVKKENGKWQISYLQGFDFNEAIKKMDYE